MSQTKNAFEGLLSRYFEKLLQDEPVFATINAGLASGEGKLGTLGANFHEKRQRQRQIALAALDKISPRELSNEQHIDRLALRSKLLRECEDYGRGRHTLEPNAPEQLLGVLFHELRRGQDHPRRAAVNLRSLLKAAPEFLDEAAGVLVHPDGVWLRVMEETIAGAEVLLKGVQDFLAKAGSETAGNGAIARTIKALHRYRDHARELKLAPTGSFAVGAVSLQRRVQDELGLDYTLGQIEALGLSEARRVGDLLKAACAGFGGNRSPDEIIREAREAWRPVGPLVELYQQETRRIAQAFKSARAVTFPRQDELQIRPVPEFLRALIPTAAYSQPGAFARE